MQPGYGCTPFIQCDCVGGCSVIGGWVKHVTMVGQMTTCVLPVDMQNSHVEGLFLTTVLLWLLELV